MVFGLELQCPLFSESSTLEILDLPAHSSMIQFFKISPSHSSLSLYKYVHLYTYIKIYIHVFLIINDNYLSLIILWYINILLVFINITEYFIII